MIKRITSICLAMMMLLSFIPVLGMQEAYAEGTNVGTITLDLTQENVRLSGNKLEAFNNVMQALSDAKEIDVVDFFSADATYNLDPSNGFNTYEMDRFDKEGYSEFKSKENEAFNGRTWENVISEGIKNDLKKNNKLYCDRISIIFPEQYKIWIEGKQVTSANAGNITGNGTVSYNVETNTLTLNGANLGIRTKAGATDAAAILTEGSLKINLKGKNTIVGNNAVSAPLVDVYGIKAIGNSSGLSFSGSGNLEINIIQDTNKCFGIYAGDNISFDRTKANVTVVSNNTNDLLRGINAAGDILFANGTNIYINASGKSGYDTIGLNTRSLSVSSNSIIEVVGDGSAGAGAGIGIFAQAIDDETSALGAKVKAKPGDENVVELDRTVANDLNNYNYVRIPLNHNVHAWDAGTVTKKPTATAEGEMTYKCKVCGETKTEAISNAAERAAKYSPGKVTLKSAKKGKKRATVTWRTMKNVAGYQISLTNKKNGSVKTVTVKQTKKVAKKKTVRKVVKKLSKKTKYRVQVRAYRTVGGETFYGPWSKAKNVKTR